jgi:hypothetical protein
LQPADFGIAKYDQENVPGSQHHKRQIQVGHELFGDLLRSSVFPGHGFSADLQNST